jgi:transcription termination/antitermination protein NusG
MSKINKKEIEQIEISSDERFNWYALMCIPNHEKSVKKTIESNLKLSNLDSWVDIIHVPSMTEASVKDGKRVLKDKVMIPGYILVHMDLNNGEVIPCIRNSKGVSSWLNPSEGKSKIRPEKMRRRDVDRFLNVAEEKNETIRVEYFIGEIVEIVNGAFSTFKGEIKNISGDKINVVSEIFGRETLVELHGEDIKKITN